MTTQGLPDTHWRLIGARPCLDFVNTVGGWDEGGRIRRDDLPDYESLLRWSAFASVLGRPEADRLRERARHARPRARLVLRRAVRLREALYRIGKALIEGETPKAGELRILESELREARRHQRLVARGRRLASDWIPDPKRLDRVLWPIALSAASVFGSNEMGQLRQCGGTSCGWLFLDTTRNHSRQWCRMADCGNLAKVRRFRKRHGRVRARAKRASS
ncbi:MAG TPA: ABATE domain-containing protein [Vicinamibacteria bacterium]